MDALQLLKSVNAATGFIQAAAVEVLSVEQGAASLRMPRKFEVCQFNGYFHGGAIAGLADHAAGAAASTKLPSGRIAVTADLHVNYLKPANGASITANAKVVSSGATLSVVTVEVTTEGDGPPVLCAIATATLRTVEAPQPRTGASLSNRWPTSGA
jgi:uncharacterized protein (TIGR00369 family)